MGQPPVKEQRVEAVERALSLLEAFADGAERLSLAELARATGLYRSTILRLAASLQRMGYLNRDREGWFRLGPTLWRLGSLYQRSFHLADYVRPVLAELSAATSETTAFYVREGDRRICLYRHHSSRLVRHMLEEGASLPLDRGAGGRILSAYTGGSGEFYENIRAAGIYVSDGERDPETASVAVPVFGIGEAFVGALAVLGSVSRLGGGRHTNVQDVLRDHAAKLSAELGSR
jgi:DNA-binding IclR family transcriptional regulator